MNKLLSKFSCRAVFLYLLPLFFIYHIAIENYGAGLFSTAVLLLIEYLLLAGALSFLFWLFFKDLLKANLLAFCVLTFHFFFGSFHDFLKKNFYSSFVTKYSFIIPAMLIAFICLSIYLIKTKRNLFRLAKFLNGTLVILLLVDTSTFLFKAFTQTTKNADITKQFQSCSNCSRPDVYLIIIDEYAGKNELKDLFDFDNSKFENELIKREFHVLQNTTSNYNATVYSMASLLNMDYLTHVSDSFENQRDMFICRKLINNNNALEFFKEKKYSIFNFSFFKIDDQAPIAELPFFIKKSALFTSQTFTGRLRKDLGSHFASFKRIETMKKSELYNNNKTDSLVRNIARQKQSRPKFIYAHFYMPHHPYTFDSSGKAIPFDKLPLDSDKKAYLQYLIYTNKKLVALVDFIRMNSQQPPVILLMSDHGFRQISEKVDKKYYFMNLNAVYFPNQNYSMFYNGMSNINQFRVLLNSQFGQKFSLLKDSTIFLNE